MSEAILEVNCSMLGRMNDSDGLEEVLGELADWIELRSREERITLPPILRFATADDAGWIYGMQFSLEGLRQHLDAGNDPRAFLQERVLEPLRCLPKGERPPQLYDFAGCCEEARYVVQYLAKDTTPVNPLCGGGISGPARQGWAISTEFHSHAIKFCPFCGTKAVDIKPRKS